MRRDPRVLLADIDAAGAAIEAFIEGMDSDDWAGSDMRFTWKTVHRSKGLEADYAVILGLCSGKHGFPAEIADEPLLDLVLAVPKPHPNAEERRLLYVALTRVRRQAYLLAEGGSPSAFVTELISGEYDIEVFGRPPESDVPCPRCGGGQLVRRGNKTDQSVF